jgi:hypothetical protein
MNQAEFLRSFGSAIRHRRAAVFVGAGVSMRSGFPSWDDLVGPLRAAADVPSTVQDATVAAEYAMQELQMTEVERLLLQALDNVTTTTTNDVVEQLLSIDFAEIWTTNFDTIIETADPKLDLVITEDDYERPGTPNSRRLTKLHGSLGSGANGRSKWLEHPVITRSDFETFERDHPLKWAMLRAQFLTSSFLFLGFSFADPNVSALLRIVRSLPPTIRRLPHFAVMKPPTGPDELREFTLFSHDLEAAGVHIVEIDNYAKLPLLLQSLRRSALPPNLFISGIAADGSDAARACTTIGAMLANLAEAPTLLSFDGSSSRAVARGLKDSLTPETYRPENIRAFYRRSPKGDDDITVPRFGTAIFTEKDLEEMRQDVFSQVRALVLIGEGDRAGDEAKLASSMGIPVIPLGATGSVAKATWETGSEACGFNSADSGHHWKMLQHDDPSMAAGAAMALLQQVLPAS